MCGISGIIGNTYTNVDFLTQKIRQMGAWQVHRGPDEWGEWIRPGIGLGHNRLAIIDIAGGKQPMFSQDEKIVVVFNGEIFNFPELREELIKKGQKFQTDHSDTEVIVHGYREWGVEVFNYLRGMFAIGIWDNEKKQLILARDHIGIKPIYYSILPDNRGVVFASEPKAILGSGLLKPEFNDKPLADYFMFRAPREPDTFFKNIFKIPAGTYIVFDYYTGFNKSVKFWNPNQSKILKEPIKRIEKGLESLLNSTVKSHLISDVPIGIFLSGGVDSSLLSALVKRHSSLEAFVVGSYGELDETPYASAVAEKLGISLNVKLVTGQDFFKSVHDWMYYNDDPVSDPSALALMLVSELAREQGMKAMISGEGADELFAGYLSYLQFTVFYYLSKIPLSSKIGKYLAPAFARHTRDYLETLDNPVFMGTAHVSSISDLKNLLRKENHFLVDELLKSGFTPHSKSSQKVRQSMLFDQESRLPNDILARTDRATMAYSLEARVPFLDRDVIDYANNLPDSICLKLYRGETKWILKKILSQYIPSPLIYRKKRGFEIPVDKWLQMEFSDTMKQFLSEEKIEGLNYSFLRKICEIHINGDYRNTGIIWSWIVLEKWYRLWILGNCQPKNSISSLISMCTKLS